MSVNLRVSDIVLIQDLQELPEIIQLKFRSAIALAAGEVQERRARGKLEADTHKPSKDATIVSKADQQKMNARYFQQEW